MKFTLIIFWCASCTCRMNAQNINLIANPSFEFYYPNPNYVIDTSFSSVNGLLCWRIPTFGGAIYRSHNVYQDNIAPISSTLKAFKHLPRTGDSYVQLIQKRYFVNSQSDSSINIVSYVQTKLLTALQAGVSYSITAFVSAAIDDSSYVSDIWTSAPNIGFAFTTTPVTDFTTQQKLSITPQFKIDNGNFLTDPYLWIQISGTFVANGGEEYLTIGNFETFPNTTVYPYIPYQQTGNYIITSLLNVEDVSLYPDTATILINPDILNIGGDTILCTSLPFSDTITAQSGFYHYLWSNGDTGTSIVISQPGMYWCSVDFGCNWFTDTISITMDSSFNQLLPGDTSLCVFQYPYTISAPNNLSNYLWSTGDTIDFIIVSQPGWYWLQTTTPCSTHRDSIAISNTGGIFLEMPDLILCDGDTVTAHGPPNFSYVWSSGSTDSILQITQGGTYVLSVADECGIYIDSFQVLSDSAPKIKLPEEIVLCEGDVAILDATTGNSIYQWNTGSISSSISTSDSGIYTVKAINQCGQDSMTTHILTQNCSGCFATPNAFTPNDDGLNDQWNVLSLCTDINDFQLVIFNRWGERVFATEDLTQGWNGIYQEKEMEVGTYVFYLTYNAIESGKQFSQKGQFILLR